MESNKDLLKIAQEGFSLIDEYYGRKGKQSTAPTNNSFPLQRSSRTFFYQSQPQKPNVHQVNRGWRTEKIIMQKQETKEVLVKIGLEGFALLEKYYGKKQGPFVLEKPHVSSRDNFIQVQPKQACYYRYQPEKPHVYEMKPAYATEEKITKGYEAAEMNSY